ncbi:MAG: hypothetical protein L6R19_17365 [Alphaproteobacteria bacterium]|nr:hypothetical protein [Alphaproteobacteria bacterium]
MTRFRTLFAAAAMGVLGLSGAVSAQALIDPFGRDAATMSAGDMALMRQSMEKVLASKKVGTTAAWRSADSDNAGRATLRKTFTRDGMPCGEVVHEFTAGKGRRYVLPFCQVSGGQWKLAF